MAHSSLCDVATVATVATSSRAGSIGTEYHIYTDALDIHLDLHHQSWVSRPSGRVTVGRALRFGASSA
eukprot:CAMPEP_0119536974 /NCGR_PEP_ID=MMETSP1344-20130328/49743_1 /TAXON_ID=236787 /ORGANISM="Florenciella parvula, Strain CCMP2471" /LENGTH=67 /DNA_ID=CAMNT_0007579295 /DNA_START=121 /DNA_END=321 /DNA_ORIENTATION=-